MKAHIVLAHPEAKSFNAHLAGTSQRALDAAGWQTTLSDLYALDFDPREGPHHYRTRRNPGVFNTQAEQRFNAEMGTTPPDVLSEVQRLEAADLLVVHFPLWWFGMPAILKGWIDRVFVNGLMHDVTRRYDRGVCRGKKMIACVTTGAGEDTCSYRGKEGDVHLHLWPILYSFRYCGFDVFEPEVFHGVSGRAFAAGHESGESTLDEYTGRWAAVLQTLNSRALVRYNRDQDFDVSEKLVSGAPVYAPFIRHDPDPIPR